MNTKQRTMPRLVVAVCTIVSALLISIVLYIAANPLRGSEAEIRDRLLTETPLGSTYDKVLAYSKTRGWDSPSTQNRAGIPAAQLWCLLGEYQGIPFVVSVSAYWEFDATSRLQRIRVVKTRDGL